MSSFGPPPSATTTLSSAQTSMLELLQSFQDKDERVAFTKWLRTDFLPEVEAAEAGQEDQFVLARQQLAQVADDLRARVPLEAVLPSEQVSIPTTGEDAALTASNSLHLDAFLYDEEAEEQLVQEGRLSRSYCAKCGSQDTRPLQYVTHSCSRAVVEALFTRLLPPRSLTGATTLLDVGSRLGAVLYGAHLFSPLPQIVGVELNADLCRLQQETVAKFGMADRVRVVHAELTTVPDVVRAADVVVLNNVFDWFMPPQTQAKMWNFLRENVRPGARIVASPGIHESLQHLQTGIVVDQWVRLLNSINRDVDADTDELQDMRLYEVLPGR